MTSETISVNQDIRTQRREAAEAFQKRMQDQGTCVIRLLSSPGSGKTTLLEETAKRLGKQFSVGILVGDIATTRDAERLSPLAATAQITTGGACHLELPLVEKILPQLGDDVFDFLFIEDVGNLVCPASHDLGEHLRALVLSTTEGDDKPGKYPKAFRTSQVVVINKIDLLPYVPFSLERAMADARDVRGDLEFFPMAALSGDGVDLWCGYLRKLRETMLAERAPSNAREGQAAMPSAAGPIKYERASLVAEEIVLRGRLQGMGVRPAIYRLATKIGIAGMVQNTPQGITIRLEGTFEQTRRFKNQLLSSLPKEAQVIGQKVCEVPLTGSLQFEIVKEDSHEAIVTTVPLDTAVCHECLAEVRQLGNRRYRYPFNSCARCGPRYTIIRQMPFERAGTAMAEFPMCSACRTEYRSPEDRRFHAQTVSCPECGPRLWSMTAVGQRCLNQDDALNIAAQALLGGLIVAMKGVGGYQLLVDATNTDAVERLRQKKGRISKPFAVMLRTLAEVESAAEVDDAERLALTSGANPIVLLRPKNDTNIVPGVHPGLNTVGMMLPTSPLHDLLLEQVGRPLVCTSGNREGEPLAFEVEEAETILEGLCDLWLHHNRPIVRPIDDSVVRVIDGNSVSLRLARGMAPHRLNLDAFETQVALGGQVKTSAAWSQGESACLGPHVGDLASLAGQERYLWHLADWQSLYRFSSTRAVHDQHPDYFTTRVAERLFSESIAVQHHNAHLLAAMLEHQLLDRTVLGVVWDGTGYGTDQNVWGGEFFVANRTQCTRIGHLCAFGLPGGESAIRQPWRTALSLLSQLDSAKPFEELPLFKSLRQDVSLVNRILDNPQFSPETTSGGRLFDGVAALILGRQECEYEGQLPMMLEAIADGKDEGVYEFAISRCDPMELDWRPMLRHLLEDIASNVCPGRISMRFHRGVAKGIVNLCHHYPELPVVLAGGVFQNRLLTELIAKMTPDRGQVVYLPGIIPPGDGGLAAGQLVGALSK